LKNLPATGEVFTAGQGNGEVVETIQEREEMILTASSLQIPRQLNALPG
jgi:hypothetical protein